MTWVPKADCKCICLVYMTQVRSNIHPRQRRRTHVRQSHKGHHPKHMGTSFWHPSNRSHKSRVDLFYLFLKHRLHCGVQNFGSELS